MRNIFVHATVDLFDNDIVEKKVSKAFYTEFIERKEKNPVNYINKHDYFYWLLHMPRELRKEVKQNITQENYLYPVSVNINDIIDVESEFWQDLRRTHEPLTEKNVVVSISEKAAFMLNGSTFSSFFNHPEFSPCISDLWECSPQNELVGFEPNVIWEKFVENCKRFLIPNFKHKRFYIKCNSSDSYTVFLNSIGVEFNVIPVEYFLYDTFRTCGLGGFNMDWDKQMSKEDIVDLIWTDDKKYNALYLNRMPKEHRAQSLIEAGSRDLLKDMIWSCGYKEDFHWPNDADVLGDLPKLAEGEPYENISNNDIPVKHDRVFNVQWLLDCKINIVSESHARDLLIYLDPPHPVRFLTEKIFKPMAYGMPFMVIGGKGTLARLHDLGFKTFPEWFDESYDMEENFNLRIKKMYDSYEKFLSEDHSIDEIKNSLEHNFNRLYDRFWIMSRMVDPIRLIWDDIEQQRATFKAK